jgi:RNA 2',3'-cyclic 3'-phosphodiesterase
VRLFLAINLTEDVRRRAYEAAAPLRAAAPAVGWVAERNLHLTLKFLGEVPGGGDEIVRGVQEAAGRHAGMTLSIGGFGAFPNMRRPRVVWLGVAAEPRLELLHHDVEVACAALGFAVEGRPFRPHVTLGRVKGAMSPDEARALAVAARSARFRAGSAVESVDVMRSELSPGGSRYTVLAALPLPSSRSA